MSNEEKGEELIACARFNELEELKSLLVDETIDVNYETFGKNTALHMAAANGHVDAVKLLIEHGAQHRSNGSGNTPLQWAVLNKHTETVKAILDGFPDIDVTQKNTYGKSALSVSVSTGIEELMRLIFSHPSANRPLDADASSKEKTVAQNQDDHNAVVSSQKTEVVHSDTNETSTETTPVTKVTTDTAEITGKVQNMHVSSDDEASNE